MSDPAPKFVDDGLLHLREEPKPPKDGKLKPGKPQCKASNASRLVWPARQFVKEALRLISTMDRVQPCADCMTLPEVERRLGKSDPETGTEIKARKPKRK